MCAAAATVNAHSGAEETNHSGRHVGEADIARKLGRSFASGNV